jgi:hypothetical protein
VAGAVAVVVVVVVACGSGASEPVRSASGTARVLGAGVDSAAGSLCPVVVAAPAAPAHSNRAAAIVGMLFLRVI